MLRQINRSSEQPGRSRLSEVEQRVLALAAQGLSNKEIAGHLALSRMTVHAHMSAILSKLNVANRTQAALYALKQGWVSLDQPQKSNRPAVFPLLGRPHRDRFQSP
jgi:NarL family two-component system response regulator LiaR